MDIEELKELVTQSIVEGVDVNDTINGVLKDIDNFESESKSDFEPLVIKADHAVLLAELEEKFDCVIKITIDCLWCNAPVDSGESLYRHKAKEEIKSVLYENLSSK